MSKKIPLEQLDIFSTQNWPNPSFHFSEGAAFLIHKPLNWTSFDVVERVRNLTKAKTGHAGTLDPLAEGLLILCCGQATKSVPLFQQLEKYYSAEITFGASTPSYDAALDIDEKAPYEHITEQQIRSVIKSDFTGDITQYPPVYSAIKKNGKRLYEYAREDKEVDVPPRIVSIHQIELIEYDPPVAKLKIRCGGGTYIRSIAHDLGKKLDSRGYLSRLTRTAIGSYTNDKALSINQLKKAFNQKNG